MTSMQNGKKKKKNFKYGVVKAETSISGDSKITCVSSPEALEKSKAAQLPELPVLSEGDPEQPFVFQNAEPLNTHGPPVLAEIDQQDGVEVPSKDSVTGATKAAQVVVKLALAVQSE